MLIAVYDGTFQGLLSLFAELFRRDLSPAEIGPVQKSQGGLFDDVLAVDTDEDLAARFGARIEKKTGVEALRNLYHGFLSETEGIELLLWHYLCLGRQVGGSLNSHLSHPAVLPVHTLVRRVRHEAHRMKGFIRFTELAQGYFYAPIETDHLILPLIADHFAARYSVQQWMIHDRKRGKGVLFNGQRWGLVNVEATAVPEVTSGEESFQKMWRHYFRGVAIDERKNVRLQNAKVPTRYRRQLFEFDI